MRRLFSPSTHPRPRRRARALAVLVSLIATLPVPREGGAQVGVITGLPLAFDQSLVFLECPPKTTVVAVDLNLDGKMDLVTNGSILLGNGNGTFQSPLAFDSGGGVASPADLTRDGRPDLVNASGVGLVSVLLNATATPLPATVASILPASRTVSALGGVSATAFATVLNPTGTPFAGCDITPLATLPATFLFQATDPGTNAPSGAPNTRVGIGANGIQTFVIAFTPTGPFASTEGDTSSSLLRLSHR